MIKQLIRRMPAEETAHELEPLSLREWLVTNGLSGYASGTVSGVVTRRYHGLLVAALPAPLGRMMMLSHLSEYVRLPDDRLVTLTGAPPQLELPTRLHDAFLAEFRLETGIPVWRYEASGLVIEKTLVMPREQNSVYISYRLVSGQSRVRLKLMPSVHFRHHDAPVSTPLPETFVLTAVDGRLELRASDHAANLPPLRLRVIGSRSAFTSEPKKIVEMLYPIEGDRGYESIGDLWSPGYFRVDLHPDEEVCFIASTEDWDRIEALKPHEVYESEANRRKRLLQSAHPELQSGVGAELVIAADQFITRPVTRSGEAVRASLTGEVAQTIIAGYHWFTDWGRDTMISLEGLTLVTGRHQEASHILRTFARHIKNGLIPNLFPEGENEGLYHTADATLWFFHAVDRYIEITGDKAILDVLLPKLFEIFQYHEGGTNFGIQADPEDGLLRQGQEGYQLTWMDAKVGNWVVTPRRGKAVEINALWYNALRLLEGWLAVKKRSAEADHVRAVAEKAYRSFNQRFWLAERRHLYDVVDGVAGDDPACRPNQIIAVSLRHPVLAQDRWESVLSAVTEQLLTPVGLRSLAPGHPDYRGLYSGDLLARDAAYHQGTVWSWLIGPFVDAWLRVHPGDIARTRTFLLGLIKHLDDACIGSISEIFDAEPPFTPRGCVAQAWGVAEAARCWLKTSGVRSPHSG